MSLRANASRSCSVPARWKRRARERRPDRKLPPRKWDSATVSPARRGGAAQGVRAEDGDGFGKSVGEDCAAADERRQIFRRRRVRQTRVVEVEVARVHAGSPRPIPRRTLRRGTSRGHAVVRRRIARSIRDVARSGWGRGGRRRSPGIDHDGGGGEQRASREGNAEEGGGAPGVRVSRRGGKVQGGTHQDGRRGGGGAAAFVFGGGTAGNEGAGNGAGAGRARNESTRPESALRRLRRGPRPRDRRGGSERRRETRVT